MFPNVGPILSDYSKVQWIYCDVIQAQVQLQSVVADLQVLVQYCEVHQRVNRVIEVVTRK
jgi:hypothetical protein